MSKCDCKTRNDRRQSTNVNSDANTFPKALFCGRSSPWYENDCFTIVCVFASDTTHTNHLRVGPPVDSLPSMKPNDTHVFTL